MKKCPYCAEEIQDDAIKCKHCGEWLNTEADTVIHTQKDIKDKVPQERPFSEKSKIKEPTIMRTSTKKDVREIKFKRFKIFTILVYIIPFSYNLLMIFEGTNYEVLLTMIWAVCFVIVAIMFWVYLWKCVKIVQKIPLYYIALCVFVPVIGAAWAYTRLKSHYDYPSPEKW